MHGTGKGFNENGYFQHELPLMLLLLLLLLLLPLRRRRAQRRQMIMTRKGGLLVVFHTLECLVDVTLLSWWFVLTFTCEVRMRVCLHCRGCYMGGSQLGSLFGYPKY